jgi:hypothetical protein
LANPVPSRGEAIVASVPSHPHIQVVQCAGRQVGFGQIHAGKNWQFWQILGRRFGAQNWQPTAVEGKPKHQPNFRAVMNCNFYCIYKIFMIKLNQILTHIIILKRKLLSNIVQESYSLLI